MAESGVDLQLDQVVLPWECRDKEDEAKAVYNQPLRRSNQVLTEENLRLKRILRENGIAWSPIAQAHLKQKDPEQRKTRSCTVVSSHPSRLYLPTEVLLRILKFALKSPHTIIDPLCALKAENLSDAERSRGNQIAIHLLATCKAMYVEGSRYFWESNHFTFTTVHALRNFSQLNFQYRHKIAHVNLRIIAKYYDDQRRKHKLDRCYHSDLKRDQSLKVHTRPREGPLVRSGFRCYTWNQIADFLTALRAPYDPAYRDQKNPRPRLLPSLTAMRIDLVNFSDTMLPFSGSELHEVASHELGCTLNELQITGMPYDDTGMKASAELSGMLKDEGLYLDAPACFISNRKCLHRLSGDKWCARVIRAWKGKNKRDNSDDDDDDEEELHFHATEGYHNQYGSMPPAPVEKGHPTSTLDEKRILWKRVPCSRDDDKRDWVQFSRTTGYEIVESAWDSDDDRICPCCGDSHPGSSFLDFLLDDDADDE